MASIAAQQGARGRRRQRTAAGDPAMVIGYVRVSTEDQRLGPDAQRAALATWCAAHGARLVAVHEDLGVSGGTELERRPGLGAALEAIREHGAGVLLVAKRDRLARDVVVAAVVERLVERSGARILSANDAGNGAAPEDQLLRTLVDAFAQYERALIRTRTRDALGRKRARQEKTGGDVPYGFRLAADRVHLEPEPREAAVVARARELRTKGLALRAVGAALAREGLLPRRGRVWHPMTVARIVAA